MVDKEKAPGGGETCRDNRIKTLEVRIRRQNVFVSIALFLLLLTNISFYFRSKEMAEMQGALRSLYEWKHIEITVTPQ